MPGVGGRINSIIAGALGGMLAWLATDWVRKPIFDAREKRIKALQAAEQNSHVDYYSIESGCNFASIKIMGHLPAGTKPTPTTPVYAIKARCSGEGLAWTEGFAIVSQKGVLQWFQFDQGKEH